MSIYKQKGETMIEADKQMAVIEVLRLKNIPFIVAMNENTWSGALRGALIELLGKVAGNKKASSIITRIVAKNRKMGQTKGAWDILILATNASGSKLGLFIEMKHGKNKLTAEQKAFKEKNPNYAYVVAYESMDAIDGVKEYLKS